MQLDNAKPDESLMTWSGLVHEAALVFKRDGTSPSRIVKFLKALSTFQYVPESATPYDIKKFSQLLQDSILQEMQALTEDVQIKVHYYTCLILTRQFASKARLISLNISFDSVKQLSFSKYLNNESLAEKHHEVTKECAKLFLRRINEIPPTVVLQDMAHLMLFSREEQVARADF